MKLVLERLACSARSRAISRASSRRFRSATSSWSWTTVRLSSSWAMKRSNSVFSIRRLTLGIMVPIATRKIEAVISSWEPP